MVADTTAADGSCVCETAGFEQQSTLCVNSTLYTETISNVYSISTSNEVRYTNVISETTNSGTGIASQSNTFEYLLPQAIFECVNYQYYKQCQILANLCVLQMYSESSAPCEALQNLANNTSAQQNDFYTDPGWKQGLPWLYYLNSGDQVLYNRNRVKAKMTLETGDASDTRYAYIPFKLAKYAFDGEFLGWEDLSNQIWMCPVTVQDSQRYRRVGLGLVTLCDFDLHKLVDKDIPLDNLNYFYELFLVDFDGSLIDVPVLIDNFVDSTLTYPNRASGNPANWRFVRRFFKYENVSAIEGVGEYLNPTQPPTYVRFIHESRLVFEIDTDSDEQIFVPYLHLWYRSIETSNITSYTPTPIVVVTQWKMSADYPRELLFGFMIATHVLIFAWVVWKCYKWVVLHPQNYESSEFIFYIGRVILYEALEAWSGFMFWFLFLASFIWFILFKFETAFYILLTNNYSRTEIYRNFDIVFGFVLCLKILTLWGRIWYQANIDIFFLDRERPKSDSYGSPNAWRLIFVANEYNEMQNSQYISIEYTLIWF